MAENELGAAFAPPVDLFARARSFDAAIAEAGRAGRLLLLAAQDADALDSLAVTRDLWNAADMRPLWTGPVLVYKVDHDSPDEAMALSLYGGDPSALPRLRLVLPSTRRCLARWSSRIDAPTVLADIHAAMAELPPALRPDAVQQSLYSGPTIGEAREPLAAAEPVQEDDEDEAWLDEIDRQLGLAPQLFSKPTTVHLRLRNPNGDTSNLHVNPHSTILLLRNHLSPTMKLYSLHPNRLLEDDELLETFHQQILIIR